MKYLIISILLFVAMLNVFGQKATDANVVGDVKDKKSGEHIPFINVHLVNTLIGTSTDHTGHYFLKNLPEGTYRIRVSGIGYKTVEQEVQIIAGKTIEINFVTEESTLALDEVVVSA
ncbi:MAG TPA: carboxypeptidase-like regulatory domain-containing protein, partial [Bacteroidales bacterium]|nr:carboxypeptidase-like regulatory domain-containing protein [Bacteroidales bacterium]